MKEILYKYIKFYNEFTDNVNEKYNIISISVFRLENNYKNEYNYTDGLHLLLNTFEKYFPGFYLRVYYDNSVLDYKTKNKKNMTFKVWKPLFDKLRFNKKVQMVKFEMKDFKKNDIHHNGLIGTIPRLYPIFDTEHNKNINSVIIIDIDIDIDEIKSFSRNYYKINNNNNNINFFYETANCYNLQDRFQIMQKYFDTKFSIIAGSIISKIKLPINIFDDFFNCVLNFKNDKKCQYYEEFDKFMYPSHHSKSGISEKYKYGIDEVLTLLIKKYLYDNKIKHLVLVRDNSIAKPLYNMFVRYQNKNISEYQFKNFLIYLLKDNFNVTLSLYKNYLLIDKIIYRGESYENINKHIILERIKKLIDDISTNKINVNDYGFDESEIECIKLTDINGEQYYTIDYPSKN